ELYPAMQLGGAPPALYDQIRDGVIDGGWTLPAYTPGRFPETEVFELPFMTTMSAEDSSRAAWEFSERYVMDRMSDIKVLAVHVHGPGIIHKKGPPVKTLADFDGLKLRGPSRQANQLLESMGASPVGIPVPAFPEALSKGVVQGGVIPYEIVPPLKVHELADSHTQIGGDRALYNTFFIWGMNLAAYEALPDDLKAVIDANSGIEVSAMAGKAMDDGDVRGLAVIEGTDNEVHTLDAAVVSEIRAMGEAQTEAWIEEVTSKGLAGQEMVDFARELVEKYSAAM
ncbi:MAG: TRAP transporter substrate-binding protein, partial [Pseudomonadota bacterium]